MVIIANGRICSQDVLDWIDSENGVNNQSEYRNMNNSSEPFLKLNISLPDNITNATTSIDPTSCIIIDSNYADTERYCDSTFFYFAFVELSAKLVLGFITSIPTVVLFIIV